MKRTFKSIMAAIVLFLIACVLEAIICGFIGVVIGVAWKFIFVPCCGFKMMSLPQLLLFAVWIRIVYTMLKIPSVSPSENQQKSKK